MNDQTNIPQDDDLEGFDTFEDETLNEDPDLGDEPTLDADFQDISDEVDADVFGEGEPAPPAKKKTSWFNIGVAVVAIAVAGGLIFMKLGPTLMGGDTGAGNAPMTAGNATAPTPGVPGAGNTNAQEAAQAALAPNGPAGNGQTPGLLDSPDQYATLATNTPPPAAAVMPSSDDPFAGVPAQPGVMPAPGAAPAPTLQPVLETAQSPVPMPAPISTTPTLADSPADVPAGPAVTATPIQPAPLAPVAAAPAAAPAPADIGLESKVSALESRLNDMDSKLAAIATAPATDDSRLNAIQTSLERLESRLDDMASRRTPVREASAPAADSAPVITGDAPKAAPKKQPARKSAPKAKKPASNQWDAPYSPSRATPVSTGSGKWELRGAMPGRATLARGSDIREVGVGETVPGLGEITGVAQMNGKWVVQGTQGAVAQ